MDVRAHRNIRSSMQSWSHLGPSGPKQSKAERELPEAQVRQTYCNKLKQSQREFAFGKLSCLFAVQGFGTRKKTGVALAPMDVH